MFRGYIAHVWITLQAYHYRVARCDKEYNIEYGKIPLLMDYSRLDNEYGRNNVKL